MAANGALEPDDTLITLCEQEIPIIQKLITGPSTPSDYKFDYELLKSFGFIMSTSCDSVFNKYSTNPHLVELTKIRNELIQRIINFYQTGHDDLRFSSFLSVIHYVGSAGMKYEAFRFLEKAANENWADAQTALGDYYLSGNEDLMIFTDKSTALKYFLMAAKSNSPSAHYAESKIGEMFQSGTAVVQNYSEALKYFRLAAKGNYPYAMEKLADLYASDKIETDFFKAYVWYNIAAAHQGFSRGTYYIEQGEKIKEKRDAISRRLSREKILEAQNFSSNCMQNNFTNCD